MSTQWRIGIVVALVLAVVLAASFKSGPTAGPAPEAVASTPALGESLPLEAPEGASADTGEPSAGQGASAGPSDAPDGDRLPRLLQLGADQCVPCRMMRPVLDEVRSEYEGRLQVDFVDVYENPRAARSYSVRGIPTQIFFDAQGREVGRHSGFLSREKLVAELQDRGLVD